MKRLWSIFTDDLEHCMFTGTAPVERHHVFGASCKKASEQRGFIAPLSPHLHPNGVQAGADAKDIDRVLKVKCFEYYLEHYGTEDDFRKEFIKVPL